MTSKPIVRSLVVVALIGVFASSFGWGQTARQDVSIQFGIISLDQIMDVWTNVFTIMLTMGLYAKNVDETSGVPFITYHFPSRGRFALGLALGGYTTKGDLDYNFIDSHGTYKETNYIGAVEAVYRWIMKDSFLLYSGLGVGGRIRSGTYNVEGQETASISKVLPTFHANLIGLRFGRTIGFFTELGLGYKGLLNIGLNARF